MGDDWVDIEAELNTPSGPNSFYRPQKLPVGTSEEIVVLSHLKWTDTQFPIKDRDGNSKGFTWRFRLAGGQVWDVSNANRKLLLAGLHPKGTHAMVPGRFRITNVGKVVNKQPAIQVEFLGSVEGTELLLGT